MAQEEVCLYFLSTCADCPTSPSRWNVLHFTGFRGRPHHVFYDKLESFLVLFFSGQRIYAITLDIKKSNKP